MNHVEVVLDSASGPAAWMAIGILIGCCFMAGVVPAVLRCYTSLVRRCFASKRKLEVKIDQAARKVERVTVADLQNLVQVLEERDNVTDPPWEHAIQKSSPTVSYCAWRRDPKDGGPTQVLSTTVFEDCSTELARDFYMDGEFRKQWDGTFVTQEQLELCDETGTEIGRVVKKFPLLSPREYVLAWRVWEGEDKSFFCCIKACEHELVPLAAKFKRVETYHSGWRIRRVPGRNACEISMFHQEDLCMQREMGKVAFSRGIWSYVRKMETNLRKFAQCGDTCCKGCSAVSLAQKVPAAVLAPVSVKGQMPGAASLKLSPNASLSTGNGSGNYEISSPVREAALRKKVAKGLIFLGGAVVFSQSTASWGAKIAAVCLVKRLVRPQTSCKKMRT